MFETLKSVQAVVGAWPEMAVLPYEFGGVIFMLGHTEIGHLHNHGMLDLRLLPALKKQLVAEGRANEHHIRPQPERASFFLEAEDDSARAIWLLRVSYLSHLLAETQPADERAERAPRVRAALPALELSAPLRAIFDQLLAAAGG